MRRWTGIAGIVWVVLAFVSRAVRGNVPDASNGKHGVAKMGEFYATKSHYDHALPAAVLGLIGLFFFAWFLGGVVSRLREADGVPGPAMIVMALGGAAFIALAAMEHVLDNGVGITLHFVKDYKLDPGLTTVASTMATGAFLSAMIAIGAVTSAAGVIIMRTRTFPVWIAWIGFAVAVLSLPMIPPLSFIAALLLAIWTLAISVLSLAQSGAPAPAQ
jgi:hypothetical protein